jgi:hypothetical protein
MVCTPQFLKAAGLPLNDLLRMWPVSKRVNVSRRGGDDPILIAPLEDAAIAEG